MNATKRKFNTLLQGLGGKTSATSLPSDNFDDLDESTMVRHNDLATATASVLNRTPTAGSTASAESTRAPVSALTAELLSKRRRTGVPGSTPVNEPGATIRTLVSNVTIRKSTSSRVPNNLPSEPPRYCPSDRAQLIKRLATFSELTEWTPKPDKVNEIEWAKRGWICSGKETVRCSLCNKELVVNTSRRGSQGSDVSGSEFEEALGNKFAELIVEAHQEDCLWRRRGCDDTLLRLSLTSPQTALPELRQRYDELCMRPAFLPYFFNLRLPDAMQLKMVKSHLPTTFFTDPPPPKTNPPGVETERCSFGSCLNRMAGSLQPTYWTSPEFCLMCNMHAPFGIVDVQEQRDPVREHRFFCPWRNAASQRNPGSSIAEAEDKMAWEILLQTLRNSAYLRNQGSHKKSTTPRHGRSKSSNAPTTPTPHAASSPGERPGTAGGSELTDEQLMMLGSPDTMDGEEDEGAEDKKRWARLRRVKSLFETKAGKQLRRLSRPGSVVSSRPDTAKSATPSHPDTPTTATAVGAE
ncbi:mRNA export factor rsm1 [Apiospora marii]|uniref:mRNA export factor rsm1 n=1 Tax=Apiospora marii TaxID=335849 RepID=UPI00312D161F